LTRFLDANRYPTSLENALPIHIGGLVGFLALTAARILLLLAGLLTTALLLLTGLLTRVLVLLARFLGRVVHGDLPD
jgi:ABC-type Fe3+-siderophore transport system permease subunit